jgi:thioredoxin 1
LGLLFYMKLICFYRWGAFALLVALMPVFSCGQSVKNDNTKNANGIVFIENSWIEALHQAQLQNKYIFVDAYATWCGPCNLLKNTTFKDKKVAEFYNQNFINLSMDMERGEGPDLAGQWGITAYPTLIVFDSNGKPVFGTMGYMGAKDLLKFGKQALSKTAN